jgi:hypothetical protein
MAAKARRGLHTRVFKTGWIMLAAMNYIADRIGRSR